MRRASTGGDGGLPSGFGSWAESNASVKICLRRAQQAIAALRVNNGAEAAFEIAQCCSQFSSVVGRHVGERVASLAPDKYPRAAMLLRLFIASVRWQKPAEAEQYLNSVGT